VSQGKPGPGVQPSSGDNLLPLANAGICRWRSHIAPVIFFPVSPSRFCTYAHVLTYVSIIITQLSCCYSFAIYYPRRVYFCFSRTSERVRERCPRSHGHRSSRLHPGFARVAYPTHELACVHAVSVNSRRRLEGEDGLICNVENSD
jgi:hypothetical protein